MLSFNCVKSLTYSYMFVSNHVLTEYETLNFFIIVDITNSENPVTTL